MPIDFRPENRIDFQLDFQPDTEPFVGDSQPPPRSESARLDEETTQMPGWQQFLIGVGGGAHRLYTGAKQLGATIGESVGLAEPGTVDRITAQEESDRKLYNELAQRSRATRVGDFWGGALPAVPIPGGVSGGAIRRASTAALGGGLIGATQYVPPEGSRAGNTAIGAGMGGATSLAASGVGKLYNAAIGDAPQNPVREAGERYKIPTTLAEERGDLAARAETLLERSPGVFGIKKFRQKQADAADAAAKNLLADYMVNPNATDVMAANRAYASQLFDDVRGLAAQIPDQAIAPTRTRDVASKLLDRYSEIFKRFQDTKLEKDIRNIISGADRTNAAPGASLPVPPTFEEMWELRKGLGEKIGQARKLLARGEVDETAYGQLKALFGAVSEDIDNWTASVGSPEISQGLQAANDAYKKYVVKADVLQRAYDKVTKDVGDKTLFSPARFSNELTTLIDKNQYTKKFTPAEIDEMAGLANILQVVKRAGQFQENPPTGNRWGPFSGVVALVGSSVGYSLASLPAALATAGGLAGSSLLARMLTTTRFGKDLVRAASKIEPDSPTMQRIMAEVYNQLPKFAANEATKIEGPNPDSPEEISARQNIGIHWAEAKDPESTRQIYYNARGNLIGNPN